MSRQHIILDLNFRPLLHHTSLTPSFLSGVIQVPGGASKSSWQSGRSGQPPSLLLISWSNPRPLLVGLLLSTLPRRQFVGAQALLHTLLVCWSMGGCLIFLSADISLSHANLLLLYVCQARGGPRQKVPSVLGHPASLRPLPILAYPLSGSFLGHPLDLSSRNSLFFFC